MDQRQKWKHKIDFFFNVAGMTIGLGNIWRFPYLCYKNGGGVFLIPYIIAVIVIGFPLFFLETSFGQFVGKGMTKAWAMIPLAKGIGYANAMITWYGNGLYGVVLAWACRYFVASFSRELPWTSCNNSWNTDNCIGLFNEMKSVNMSFDDSLSNASDTNFLKKKSAAVEYWEHNILRVSSGIDDVGKMNWEMFFYLLCLWVVAYLCIFQGIKWSTKVVYVTATVPIVMLLVILVRGVTLDGASDGLMFYLNPNISRLADAQVWMDAVTQVYYSYGVGSGALVTLASYNNFNHNIYRDAIMVAIVNSGTSFLAGFAVFSTLGFMAKEQNISINAVAESGPGLVFIAYPQALSLMPLPQFWNALFFLMILFLGFDCLFVFQECLVVSVMDFFPWWYTKRWGRAVIQAAFVILIFAMACSMITEGGIYVFLLLNDYAGAGWCLFFIGTFEFLAISWLYGADRFCNHVRTMLGTDAKFYFMTMCWKYLGPMVSLGILVYWLSLYEPLVYNKTYVYPVWAQVIGWCLGLSSCLWIPLYASYRYLTTQGNLIQRLRNLLTVQTLKQQDPKPYKVSVIKVG